MFLGNGIISCSCKIISNVLKGPKNADVSKKSVKNWKTFYIKFGFCDCKEHENTKALIEKTCIS